MIEHRQMNKQMNSKNDRECQADINMHWVLTFCLNANKTNSQDLGALNKIDKVYK